ncbi:MAG: hypothetical protein ACM3QZ_01920 [Solirubrobacterales bacterium]
MKLVIPNGIFQNADPLAEARKKLRDELLNAKPAVITETGDIKPADQVTAGEQVIEIPAGKLAF